MREAKVGSQKARQKEGTHVVWSPSFAVTFSGDTVLVYIEGTSLGVVKQEIRLPLSTAQRRVSLRVKIRQVIYVSRISESPPDEDCATGTLDSTRYEESNAAGAFASLDPLLSSPPTLEVYVTDAVDTRCERNV